MVVLDHSTENSTRTANNNHHGGHGTATTRAFTSQLIKDFLPIQKHAVFHVKLDIHQLQSVPLISGEFRIKWKFRNLQAVNSDGRPLGFGRTLLARKLDNHRRKSATIDASSSLFKGKAEKDIIMTATTNLDDQPLILTDDDKPPNPLTASPSRALPFELSFEDSSPDSQDDTLRFNKSTSSSSSAKQETADSFLEEGGGGGGGGSGNGVDYRLSARGYTPYHPLKDFRVKFETEINAAVQMSIEKNSFMLLPSELKLTVMQLAIPGDPAAPQNPRLGHVEVNLAEYANVGPVTRNYLLRRSKVNALLRMTLTVTHMSGEEAYHAPPLRKEEVKAGIASYLTEVNIPLPMFSESVHTNDPWLASVLPQVTPPPPPPEPEPEPELNALGLGLGGGLQIPENANAQPQQKKRWRVGGKSSNSRRTSDTFASFVSSNNGNGSPVPSLHTHHTANSFLPHSSSSSSSHVKSEPITTKHHQPSTPPGPHHHRNNNNNNNHPPKSRQKRPPPQLHPTELLIEAIFNPYPSTSDTPSPFTYYVPQLDSSEQQQQQHKSAPAPPHGGNGSDTHSNTPSISISNNSSSNPSPRRPTFFLQQGLSLLPDPRGPGLTPAEAANHTTSFESAMNGVGGGSSVVSESGHSLSNGGGGGSGSGSSSSRAGPSTSASSVHGIATNNNAIPGASGKSSWWRRKRPGSSRSATSASAMMVKE